MTGHMENDHLDSERGNPLPPLHELLLINSKGYFKCTIQQTGWYIPQPFMQYRGTLAGMRNN